MPIHLRGEKCALRGAFLRWMLFSVMLASISFLNAGFSILPDVIRSYMSRDPIPGIWAIFGGPEWMVEMILFIHVPAYYDLMGELSTPFLPVLAALRLGAVFAWGVARLRRGKHAPYAETLWLIVICAFVARWAQYEFLNRYTWGPGDRISTLFYVLQALLAITGIVVFAIQRRRPPAWKWPGTARCE